MNEDPSALLPELLLLGSALAGLLAGSWLPRRRQWPVRLLAAAACTAGIVATVFAFAGSDRVVFGTSYAIDTATNAVRLIVLASTLLVLLLATNEIAGERRETEFVVLLQLGALGTITLAGANDLLLFAAAYLLASLPLYALAAFRKDAAGTEAALKYYLLGALFGVISLAGIAIFYGAARATAYPALHTAIARAPAAALAFAIVAVLAALLFKVGGVPSHFWVPDVTEGASTAVAAFVTTVPKLGGLVAAYRLFGSALPRAPLDWPLLLALLATASMTLGNFAAFFQTNVKRLLAYSTVSQVGYMLMAVAVADRTHLALRSLLFYLAAYASANLAAFAVVAEFPGARDLDDYRGLIRERPALAAVLVIALLALVGTPPSGVFIGKLEVFTAAVAGGYAWLAVVAVLNTVASLFYYLRWITAAVSPSSGRREALAPAADTPAVTAYVAAAAALLLGPVAGLVLPLIGGPLLVG